MSQNFISLNKRQETGHSFTIQDLIPKTFAQGGIAMDFEGYCVKCRKKQKITNGSVEKTAKGKPVAKGTCPECGTKVNRFLSAKDAG
jgi:hypothetical protein